MKLFSLAMILAMSVVGWGQASHKADNATTWSAVNFQNCRKIGGTSNDPNPQDASVIYSCEGTTVTLRGKWTQAVEYGTIYHETFGQPDAKTDPATEFDRDFFSWCRRDDRVIEMCGWNPNWKPNSKISMKPWYPNPKDYPAAEVSHDNDLASDPSIPIVTREPVYKETKTCQQGWHLETWQTMYEYETSETYHPIKGYYPLDSVRIANLDSENGLNAIIEHPDKCVRDKQVFSGGSGINIDNTWSEDLPAKLQPKPCVDEEFNFNSDEGYTPVFMFCDANGDNCDTNSDRFDRIIVCKRFSSGESIDKAIRFCTDEEWKYMKPAIKMCKSNPPKPCPKVITGDTTVDCENVPKK